MNRDSVPIACDLSRLTPEQHQREQVLLSRMRQLLASPVATEDGYRFTLPATPAALSEVGEFVALERLCCPFLRFALEAPAERADASLHVFGAAGVKEFLADLLVGR